MAYTPPLQYQIRQSLRRFVSLSLLTAGLIFLVRFFEIFSSLLATGYPAGTTMELIYGLRFDLLLSLRLSALLVIPFLLIDHYSHKVANLFFAVFAIFAITAEVILILYFSITLIPLGSEILGYSISEILQIVRKSVELNLILILPVLAFLGVSIYAFCKWSWSEVTRTVIVLFVILMLGSLLAFFNSDQDQVGQKNALTRNIASNKLNNFCGSLFDYYW